MGICFHIVDDGYTLTDILTDPTALEELLHNLDQESILLSQEEAILTAKVWFPFHHLTEHSEGAFFYFTSSISHAMPTLLSFVWKPLIEDGNKVATIVK